MDGGLAPIIASSASVVGVIYVICRDSRRASKRELDTKIELKGEIRYIKDKLEDPDSGLAAIKRSTEEMKLHCAKVSTSLSVKVNNLEGEAKRKGQSQ